MCRISSSFARIAPKIFIRFVTVCPPRCAAPFAACCYSRRRLPLFLFSHGAFPPHHSRFLRPHRPHYINPPHMPHGAALRPIRRKSAFLCARTVYSDTHARSGAHALFGRFFRVRMPRIAAPNSPLSGASRTSDTPALCRRKPMCKLRRAKHSPRCALAGKITQAEHAPAFKQNSGPAARELKPVGKSSRTKLKPLRKQSLKFTVKITQTEKSLRDKKSLRINQMLWRVSVKRT